jgi:hypothetical protein
VKLRDYFARTATQWPPVWFERYEPIKSKPSGEIGTLTSVGTDCSGRTAKCHLFITYRRKPYVGTLRFSSRHVCDFFGTLLKEHYGKRIKNIGSLDISEIL